MDEDAAPPTTPYSASFEKPAAAYDRFVGRYSGQLARAMVAKLGLGRGRSVLDVGCGPGALTAVVAETVGAESTAAVEPSEPFAAACRERVPGADVHVASAEALPFADESFDFTLSQLVVNFLPQPLTGLREMGRVTKPGGTVAGSVWDYSGEMTMLRAFWDTAVELDLDRAWAFDEATRFPGCTPHHLPNLWAAAGLRDATADEIVVTAHYDDFEDLWAPFTTGVGPAGEYCASLPEADRETLAQAFHRRLGSPAGPFELSARAWLAVGTRP